VTARQDQTLGIFTLQWGRRKGEGKARAKVFFAEQDRQFTVIEALPATACHGAEQQCWCCSRCGVTLRSLCLPPARPCAPCSPLSPARGTAPAPDPHCGAVLKNQQPHVQPETARYTYCYCLALFFFQARHSPDSSRYLCGKEGSSFFLEMWGTGIWRGEKLYQLKSSTQKNRKQVSHEI